MALELYFRMIFTEIKIEKAGSPHGDSAQHNNYLIFELQRFVVKSPLRCNN